ncbi:hypothetical protein U8V72_17435 [Priestia filamentosa]|uniref:hypothetical protein n=1 Tax=Priestia filamentosa TaxID=1402861 RepID=UPI00397865E6
MGFDVVLYNQEDEELEFFELSEDFHSIIFNPSMLWKSYLELRKLSDYYLTDEIFSGEKLARLISDLERYQLSIPSAWKGAYTQLIRKLSKSTVAKVHIAGD